MTPAKSKSSIANRLQNCGSRNSHRQKSPRSRLRAVEQTGLRHLPHDFGGSEPFKTNSRQPAFGVSRFPGQINHNDYRCRHAKAARRSVAARKTRLRSGRRQRHRLRQYVTDRNQIACFVALALESRLRKLSDSVPQDGSKWPADKSQESVRNPTRPKPTKALRASLLSQLLHTGLERSIRSQPDA